MPAKQADGPILLVIYGLSVSSVHGMNLLRHLCLEIAGFDSRDAKVHPTVAPSVAEIPGNHSI